MTTMRRSAPRVSDALEAVATISGSLEATSPIELSQFLLLGRKTGTLHLVRDDQRGVLYFSDGDVVAAVGPDLRGGTETAMRLLVWDEGTFTFVREPIHAAREIEGGTWNLLLETARLTDESGTGAEEVAASLREVDELSRTFAEISASAAGRASGESAPLSWLLERPGRRLFRATGHALVGEEVTGERLSFGEAPSFDLAATLSAGHGSVPDGGWCRLGTRRVYVSNGPDGYRVVNPFPTPDPETHLISTARFEDLLVELTPTVVYGPAATGKSLVAALLAIGYARRGWRCLIVTDFPAYDLADGLGVWHETVAPDGDLSHVARVYGRWQPDVVVWDATPSEAARGLLTAARCAGRQVVLTLRTGDRQTARDTARRALEGVTAWRFVAPWPVDSGSRLEITVDAA